MLSTRFYKFTLNFFFSLLILLINDNVIKQTLQGKLYIDNSTACPTYYYSIWQVVRDCNSLNLARNTSVLQLPNYSPITQLLLANNSLNLNLPYKEINKYTSIKSLDLSLNSLTEYNTDIQLIECETNHLHEFILSRNLFTKIPLFHAECMNIMQSLIFDNNKQLTFIDDPNMFINGLVKTMPSLTKLDLSFCSLELLNSKNFSIFQLFPNLVYLNLIGNRLKFIYENPFIFMPKLANLSFELNLLQCDLTHLWLKNYLLTKNFYEVQINGSYSNYLYSPQCFNILTLKNDSIITLDPNLFVSGIYLTTSLKNLNLDVLAGDKIDLACDLYSKPVSDLWWTFNNRIISKINTADGPYEFVESFTNNNNNDLNKTSVLRVKTENDQVAGNYSCLAYYSNYEPNYLSGIKSVDFKLNIKPNPNLNRAGGLSAGEIAAIVIGSLIGFLLLCLLAFLLIYCCCYRYGICCFAPSVNSSNRKKSSLSVVSMLSADEDSRRRKMLEQEEKAAGFTELNRTKPPNYIINTISKSSNNLNVLDSKSKTEIYPDTSSTWRFTGNSNVNQQQTNYNLIESHSMKINSPKTNPAMRQDLVDNQAYDETMLYNMKNGIDFNGKYTINKRQSQQQQQQQQNQIYTIKHPIDYGSSYNTNEGYLIENIVDANVNLNNCNNQAELIQQQELQQQQQNYYGQISSPKSINKTNIYQSQYKFNNNAPFVGTTTTTTTNINTNNNGGTFGYQIPIEQENNSFSSEQQTNIKKQYVYSSVNYNSSNVVNNNSSFAKYDSDV